VLRENELVIIKKLAKKYKLKKVFLFGSSAEGSEYNDIDLAVDGIEPGFFFNLYAELFKYLPKPVDLIDLKHKTAFNELIKETGLKIYG